MEEKKNKKSLFRKDLKFYFAASRSDFLISMGSALVFFLFTLFLYAYSSMTSVWICLAMTVILLADGCNLLVMDNENIWHFHLFHFSAPRTELPLKGIRLVSTTMEKNKEKIFIGSVYTHVTVAKNKKLWRELLAHLNIPAEELEAFLRCEGGRFDKKLEGMTLHSEHVNIPQLFGTKAFTSYEINLEVKEETKEEIFREMEEKNVKKDIDTWQKR